MGNTKDRSNNRSRVWFLGAVALAIILITVFAIKWPLGNKVLGDEYSSHIYCYKSFRLLSASVNEQQIFNFNYDSHYNDTFTFTYDEGTDSYTIHKIVRDVPMYLGVVNGELILSFTDEGEAYRWNVERVDNTMYFRIINSESGLGLYETEDSHAVLMPVDENDTNMQMRLQ